MENIPGGVLTKGPRLEDVRQHGVARQRSNNGTVKRRAETCFYIALSLDCVCNMSL